VNLIFAVFVQNFIKNISRNKYLLKCTSYEALHYAILSSHTQFPPSQVHISSAPCLSYIMNKVKKMYLLELKF